MRSGSAAPGGVAGQRVDRADVEHLAGFPKLLPLPGGVRVGARSVLVSPAEPGRLPRQASWIGWPDVRSGSPPARWRRCKSVAIREESRVAGPAGSWRSRSSRRSRRFALRQGPERHGLHPRGRERRPASRRARCSRSSSRSRGSAWRSVMLPILRRQHERSALGSPRVAGIVESSMIVVGVIEPAVDPDMRDDRAASIGANSETLTSRDGTSSRSTTGNILMGPGSASGSTACCWATRCTAPA